MADVTIREEPLETTQELSAEPPPETDTVPAADRVTGEEPLPLESSVPEAEPQEPLPKRKPGRPQGSKSKEPGKPRKPRAKKVEFVKEEAVESVAVVEQPRESSPAAAPRELPRAIPGSLPIPEEAHDLRAAKMLRLLQIHSDHRKQQKRQMYSNWFR